jgi:hypothetical protein
MSTSTYHIHHIIPKHMGGTNVSSNLIRLTIEEHADAHRVLYEQYGKLEDLFAWKSLSGRTEEAEAARRQLVSHRLKHKPKTEEHKQKIRESLKKNPPRGMLGKRQSSEWCQQHSERMKFYYETGQMVHPRPNAGKRLYINPLTKERKYFRVDEEPIGWIFSPRSRR